MIKLLSGDNAGAAAEVQGLLFRADAISGGRPLSEAFLRFAAEYYYDFGSLLRSAEYFSRISGDNALLRQADALWLAGLSENARLLWALSGSPRSLYNLALTAPSASETLSLLQRLILPESASSPHDDIAALCRQYGLVRYSRFLAAPEAIAILTSAADKDSPVWPLVDLEMTKRRAETFPLGRTFAETWLLLNRHPENESLYKWALWYFNYQRNYSEAALLLRNAAHHFEGSWINLFAAIGFMHEGDLESAGEILAALAPEKNNLSAKADWSAMANLGLIWETNRSPVQALEYYEIAAAELQDPIHASKIQTRIARCLVSLGRPQDARRALEYALDLNPENLNARLELDRLDHRD
jgi:hypothetical protein